MQGGCFFYFMPLLVTCPKSTISNKYIIAGSETGKFTSLLCPARQRVCFLFFCFAVGRLKQAVH